MRDDNWLKIRLDQIWRDYFADIPIPNQVIIKFGRRARTRLGSIRMIRSMKNKVKETNISPNSQLLTPNSEITLTGFFKDERVPEYVIDLTIAHELCHYAHGFSSPLPQLSRYPHQGGIVDKELVKRGFGDGLINQKKWLKTEWPGIVGPHKRGMSIKRKYAKFNLFKFLNPNF